MRARIEQREAAFPAYAGMNRTGRIGSSPPRCVPRACGDEPGGERFFSLVLVAFPAHAGMNRGPQPGR